MYIGTAETVLDDKNRITVPRRIRDTMDELGHGVWYMARGFDRSIFLFPQEVWNSIREQVNRYSSMNIKALDFKRFFFASVTQVQPDRQGRIAVPQHLRDYAGMDRNVVLIGVDDHLELWSRGNWQAFQEDRGPEYKENAAPLFASDRERDEAKAEQGGGNQRGSDET
ncbi:MAG TPA: division/cell wall cluster transcriptional repressor MraZ [Candidatus Hydrogenedentes bacterium]|nr:division/cell wall cluster transcriptional repressor MraZ [Candidatus Hydrogenedentota bacterium]